MTSESTKVKEKKRELLQDLGIDADWGGWRVQVKFIPEQDLRVVDALWRAGSDGKFGYSAQKELWVQNRRYWERLFKVIDWTHGEHNFYRCGHSCMIELSPWLTGQASAAPMALFGLIRPAPPLHHLEFC